jgi:dienelactone hydrolase
VAERLFVLNRRSGPVPGVMWSPETPSRPPAVLLGHGGSGHKRSDRHLRMSHWLASTAGLAVVAIDGPYHGDRVPSPLASAVYQQLIVDEGIRSVTARMTEDWLETISALAGQALIDDAGVSVFGMSMGARFGLPAAAALGSRLRCAVLGKLGIRQTEAIHPGLCSPELMVTAAHAITAPVLFHMQWDEVFPPAMDSSSCSAPSPPTTSACPRDQAGTPRPTPMMRQPGSSSSPATPLVASVLPVAKAQGEQPLSRHL